MQISLVKHVEYFDGEVWRPIVWYSNRSDSEFDSLFSGPELIEHSDVFYNSFDEFANLIENSSVENRGLPNDLSEYLKNKITTRPGSLYGASYYLLSELKQLIENEESLLLSELKNGVDIKLFDNQDNIKSLLDDAQIKYNEYTEISGGSLVKVIKTTAKTVEQLKYISNIVSKLVYDIHGYIEDDKIRVIFYYKK